MFRKLNTNLIFMGLFVVGLWPVFAQVSFPEVKVERRPTYIPAGPGQSPWNVTRHIIPFKDIQSGGPPRDGVPALNFPAFVSGAQADRLLKPRDIVMGIAMGGQAKAYPVRILNWHEVVNDDIAGQPVLVSW